MYKIKFLFCTLSSMLLSVNTQAMKPQDIDQQDNDIMAQINAFEPGNPNAPQSPKQDHPTPPKQLPISRIQEKEAVEVELSPHSFQEKLWRKAENWWSGTDTYLLGVLNTLQPYQRIAPTVDNQMVILSAVKNLIKKGNFDSIQEFLKFAAEKRNGKPLFTIDTTATNALKDFLHTTYTQQMKPVVLTTQLIGALEKIDGTKPSHLQHAHDVKSPK